MYDEWTAGVDEACSFNLDQALLNRNEETKLIAVNFDNQVSGLLLLYFINQLNGELFVCFI